MTSYYIGYQIPYHFSTSSEYILVGTAGDFVYINDEGALASAGEFINVRDGYLTIGGALRIVELAENPDTPIDGYGYLYADSHGILHFKNDDGVDISLSGDGYMDAHVLDTDNPHETSISNIGAGTLSELNSALSDATLDDSGDPRDPNSHADTHIFDGSDKLDGYNIAIDYTPTNYTTPVNGIIGEHIAAIDAAISNPAPVDSVFGRTGAITAATDDYSASQIDNDSAVTGEQVSDALEYLDGYVSSVADDVAGISTMAVSGDLSGNLPNPTVTDLTIASEEEGSVLYFDGSNWVQLPPGEDGYVLTTHGTAAPTWEEAASGSGGSGGSSIVVMTTPGTTNVTIPTNATILRITCGGAGGGGAGGLASDDNVGGTGGNGGCFSRVTLDAAALRAIDSSLTVIVGAGGTGGVGSSGDINPGETGGYSAVLIDSSVLIRASGGIGGGVSFDPPELYDMIGELIGQFGGVAVDSDGSPATPPYVQDFNHILSIIIPSWAGAGGGGGGGSIGETHLGGDGGLAGPHWSAATPAAGGAAGAAGTAGGATITDGRFAGRGGGGGGGSNSSNGGNGGAGQTPGAGGGGGGSCPTVNTAGNGGDGGDGLVVLEWI